VTLTLYFFKLENGRPIVSGSENLHTKYVFLPFVVELEGRRQTDKQRDEQDS